MTGSARSSLVGSPRAAGFALTLAVAFALVGTRAGAAEPATLAVLDFAMAEPRGEPDAWSLGLADYFLARLQAHGAHTLERQALRHVLAERGLEDLGLTAARPLVRRKLPWVRFLLQGEIAATEAGRFELVLRAVDTQSGREVWSRQVAGSYPNDVASLLDELASETLATLPQAGDRPTVHVELPGFTRSPELALLFYKGLDHFVRGRPEFAAEYFRHGARTERGFWLASVWRMRCLEALGLSDLAETVRARLLASHPGPELLRALAPSLAHERRELVVAVHGSPAGAQAGQTDGAARGVEAAVRERLGSHPNFRVVSTRWMRALAAELDLQLSAAFDPHPLAAQPWLGADAVLRFENPQSGSGQIALELVDAISGLAIARVEGHASAAASLVDELAAQRPGDAAGRTLAALDYALPDADIGNYALPSYAYLLRAFADDPSDPVKLLQHYEMHTHHSYAEYQPGTYDHEWPYLERLWQRLLAGIDAADPSAGRWLSHALWNLRLRGYTADADRDHPRTWFNRGRDVPPLDEHFQRLLREYPKSFEADCVRYALALEHARAARHQEALALLLPLAERMPASRDPELGFELLANLYLMTARTAERSGRAELARRFSNEAARAVENYRHYGTPAALRAGRTRNGGPPVQPAIPVLAYRVPMRGGHREGSWHVQAAGKTIVEGGRLVFRRGQSIEGDIANFRARLGGGAAEPTLEHAYRRVLQSRGPEAVTSRIEFLQQLARDAARGVTLSFDMTYGRPQDTILPVLNEQATPSQRDAYEQALRDALEHLGEPPYRLERRLQARLYVAAGMLDEASALVQPDLHSPSARPRRVGVIAQAAVLRAGSGPARAAAFLADELARFERDFETARGTTYLDLVYTCAIAYEDAKQPGRAAQVYAHALGQPLFAHEAHSGERAEHQRASLRFRRAIVLRAAGEPLAAADLLRLVLASSEAHLDWMIHYSGHGAHTIDRLRLYEAAQRELEALRGGAPASL